MTVRGLPRSGALGRLFATNHNPPYVEIPVSVFDRRATEGKKGHPGIRTGVRCVVNGKKKALDRQESKIKKCTAPDRSGLISEKRNFKYSRIGERENRDGEKKRLDTDEAGYTLQDTKG